MTVAKAFTEGSRVRILVDTSILVRTYDTHSPQLRVTVDTVSRLLDSEDELCIAPQVCYEFWVVATRPISQNGLGFNAQQAEQEIERLTGVFTLLKDERTIFEKWQELVIQYQVLGKQAHDTRLVAAMQRHAITQLLTLNPKDFQRYAGITVLTPEMLQEAADDE